MPAGYRPGMSASRRACTFSFHTVTRHAAHVISPGLDLCCDHRTVSRQSESTGRGLPDARSRYILVTKSALAGSSVALLASASKRFDVSHGEPVGPTVTGIGRSDMSGSRRRTPVRIAVSGG